jgi:hypothetical protein
LRNKKSSPGGNGFEGLSLGKIGPRIRRRVRDRNGGERFVDESDGHIHREILRFQAMALDFEVEAEGCPGAGGEW